LIVLSSCDCNSFSVWPCPQLPIVAPAALPTTHQRLLTCLNHPESCAESSEISAAVGYRLWRRLARLTGCPAETVSHGHTPQTLCSLAARLFPALTSPRWNMTRRGQMLLARLSLSFSHGVAAHAPNCTDASWISSKLDASSPTK
jgi:hypothetical protein